jgi:uncharacterized OB-fold protein
VRALAQEYYAALQRGELLIQTCAECGKDSMYPRVRCPFCSTDALRWKRSSGQGRLYSFTVQRAGAPTGFEDELPYALGVVRLDEDVQVLGRLTPNGGGTWEDYAVDARVELCEPLLAKPDRPPAPWFRLTATIR